MGALKLLLVAVLVPVLAVVVFKVYSRKTHVQLEAKDGWWALEEPSQRKPNEEIRPFIIHFSDEILEDLNTRLKNTRYMKALEGTEFEYGTDPKYVREIVEYWLTKYDWRKQEELLNSFPHFVTEIEGIDVHFLHAKPANPSGKRVIPLLMVHGWPGSFFEFYKAIPLLMKEHADKDFVFEVICPSIPGYGFSEEAHRPGFDPPAAAGVFMKLMARLGFRDYYVQGGDWGSLIVRIMSVIDTSHVLGMHINFFHSHPPLGPLSYAIGHFFPSLVLSQEDQPKIFPLWNLFTHLLRETGYFHLQATRPHSVGFGLNDSPAGLAAYILEKFFVWSGCKTNQSSACLKSLFTEDELLTNLMIYWGTGNIALSMRFYKECMMGYNMMQVDQMKSDVPTGLAHFPKDVLIRSPKSWAVRQFSNVVSFTEMPRGGHFAALEEPQLFADDVRQFVDKVEKHKYL